MAKCVHLTTVHTPVDTRIYQKECRSLLAAGHRVSLIAAASDVPSGDAVPTRRVDVSSGRLGRMTLGCWRTFRAALREGADLYHFHDPELIPVGLALRAFGKRVVYDAHEDTRKQILAKKWISRPIRRLTAAMFGAIEDASSLAWSGVVTATPPIADRFSDKKTVTVHNYSLSESTRQTGPEYCERTGIVYVGAITQERGVIDMLDAVERLSDGGDPPRLSLAGCFTPAALEEEARRHPAWRSVDFHGWLPHEEIRRLVSRARVGVAPLHPLPRYVESQPVKLFEYMAAGLPVVASDFPLWREIIDGAGCGLLVRPQSPDELASAVGWLLDNPAEAAEMGRRGRIAVEEKYNWDREASKLINFYDRVLDGRRPADRERAAA